jgi:hypothetical protein
VSRRKKTHPSINKIAFAVLAVQLSFAKNLGSYDPR